MIFFYIHVGIWWSVIYTEMKFSWEWFSNCKTKYIVNIVDQDLKIELLTLTSSNISFKALPKFSFIFFTFSSFYLFYIVVMENMKNATPPFSLIEYYILLTLEAIIIF